MRKLSLLFALSLLIGLRVHADEGMWLLQLMKEQHSIDLMKQSGLQLTAEDIYNPGSISLKDAVGIFGGGCTGEIISPNGLILTNHHCGFASIQQLSSVEHDYLTDGFWSHDMSEELPCPGLSFTFVERIEDLTETVEQDIRNGRTDEVRSLGFQYCDSLAKAQLAQSDLNGKPGITTEVLPYFAGNKYYIVYYKVYSDVRLVAAPPQSIGKFGGETDNWMWPRHTGDFSMFRIYADANGEPAQYSKDNQPLKVKKFLPISLKGFQEGDYAMVMGFPGSTNRYLAASEVQLRMDSENTPRIAIREARLEVLRKYMAESDGLRIMYANKYAGSSNYWKNSIGMNRAIKKNRIIEKKLEQEARFARYADSLGNSDYQSVVQQINATMQRGKDAQYNRVLFSEAFFQAIEFHVEDNARTAMESYLEAYRQKDKEAIEKYAAELRGLYKGIHNKDYSHEVDRSVAGRIFPLFKQLQREALPEFYTTVDKEYKGNMELYLDNLYQNSILSSEKNLETFLKKPKQKDIDNDPLLRQAQSIESKWIEVKATHSTALKGLNLLHKTYIRGLCEMNGKQRPQYPDANFTMRLTYGNVKPYSPADGVEYNYFTTLRGVMEKEDPNNREFNVPAKLKELYEKKDYGRYATAGGELPVCFLSTNDITGGNSGSPVINAEGQLIGSAFDGNWESLSGDIHFDNNLQRCICVDIRYILFLVEKFGNCPNLIREMQIVE